MSEIVSHSTITWQYLLASMLGASLIIVACATLFVALGYWESKNKRKQKKETKTIEITYQ